MKFYVEKCLSKKGTTYICLKCDIGYRTVIVTFDEKVISTLCNLSPQDVFLLSVGDKINLDERS